MSTPSTATPPSHSLASSSSSSSEAKTGTGSSWGGRVSAAAQDPDNAQALRLIQARQRAADSMKALNMELRGSGAAPKERYASWPKGAAVEVPAAQATNVPGAPDQGVGIVRAKLVRYDAERNTFEVEHSDFSRQVLPANKVRRACRGAGSWNSSIVPGREIAHSLRK